MIYSEDYYYEGKYWFDCFKYYFYLVQLYIYIYFVAIKYSWTLISQTSIIQHLEYHGYIEISATAS